MCSDERCCPEGTNSCQCTGCGAPYHSWLAPGGQQIAQCCNPKRTGHHRDQQGHQFCKWCYDHRRQNPKPPPYPPPRHLAKATMSNPPMPAASFKAAPSNRTDYYFPATITIQPPPHPPLTTRASPQPQTTLTVAIIPQVAEGLPPSAREFQDLVRQVGLVKQDMRRQDGKIENLEIDFQTLRTEVEPPKQNSGVFSNDALNILVLHVEDFKRHFVTLQMECKWLERQHEELSDGVKELVATTEEMRSLWPQWRHAIVKVCNIMENRDSRFSSFSIEAEEDELDTDVNRQQENLEETQQEIHDIERAQMATVQTHQMDANDDPIDSNDLVGSSGSTTGTGTSWIFSRDVET